MNDDDDGDAAGGSALPLSPTGGRYCAADHANADEDDDDDDDDDDDVAGKRSENCEAAGLDCATRGGTDPCDTPFPVPWLTSAAELDELVLGGGGGVGVGGASSGGCNAGEFADDVAAAALPPGGSARLPLRSCMLMLLNRCQKLWIVWQVGDRRELAGFSESSL